MFMKGHGDRHDNRRQRQGELTKSSCNRLSSARGMPTPALQAKSRLEQDALMFDAFDSTGA